MLNEKDRAYITKLAAKNPDVACVVRLLEEDHQEMLSMISHEIRNPLTLINSTLQLMERAYPKVKDFRFWPQLQKDFQDLFLLLEDLSAYNNASGLHRQTVDLFELTKDVLHSFQAALDARHIQLMFTASSCDCGAPVLVHGDPIKLKQVLVNLMKNAMDALQDQMDGRIGITLTRSESSVSLTVSDNGCGIPAEHLDKIFLPFQTFKASGTGLGLPLSRRILQAHGGDLTVTSKCISDGHKTSAADKKYHTSFTATLQCVIN